MGGDAHKADDDIAYFAASLGPTGKLDVIEGAPVQTSDLNGPLSPGRYLLHVDGLTVAGARLWVMMDAFEVGDVLAPVAGVPCFPMSSETIPAIEVNVRTGSNDRIAAIALGGPGTLYYTLVSRAL